MEEKSFSKILEWMEKLGKNISSLREILFDHTAKLETLYDVAQETRDDLKMLKRTVSHHFILAG
jgi:hypothetical protein